uniref:Uncharacterized protein n=1 Tax=viral metagenome TaxID=1070528 RepID=A0A6C0H8A2_9ZZZZ
MDIIEIYNNLDNKNNILYYFQNHDDKICLIKNIINYNNYKYCKYKLEYYYILFNIVIDQINALEDKHILDNIIKLSNFIKIISIINKGHLLLTKLCLNYTDKEIKNYLIISSSYASMCTFVFWLHQLNYSVLNITELNITLQNKIIINSIKNTDNRLYKLILKTIIAENSIIYNNNNNIIKIMLSQLIISNIPNKFIIQRIKLLSQYINVSLYFNYIIQISNNNIINNKLYLSYYKYAQNTKTLYKQINNFDIYFLLKTLEEKYIFLICYSLKYCDNTKLPIQNLISNITLNNNLISNLLNYDYIFFLNIINISIKFTKTLKTNVLNSYILNILAKQLIVKYINIMSPTKIINKYLFLFTKFYNFNDNKYYKINLLLHHLRIYAKQYKNKQSSKISNSLKNKKNIIKDIINYTKLTDKINNLTNKISLIYLSLEELNNKQFITYYNCLIKEKTNNIPIKYIPKHIFPKCNSIYNYEVSGDYIEELDLYLLDDIIIPNMTIIERYIYLRKLHPYTKHYYNPIKINNFKNFIEILENERSTINEFMIDNTDKLIKWFPKCACHIIELNNNFYDIQYTKSNILSYNFDGIIICPL